jgi:hypothetical protein
MTQRAQTRGDQSRRAASGQAGKRSRVSLRLIEQRSLERLMQPRTAIPFSGRPTELRASKKRRRAFGRGAEMYS